MEANEAQELQEHAEHGAHESSLRPVAFTMSVVAVLVAVTTVLGHRASTDVILYQNQATDEWNQYQAHKIRSYNTTLAQDLLTVTAVSDKAEAEKLVKSYADHVKKWDEEDKDEQEQAEGLQRKVEQAEAHENRFDLAEALLEIGLVITSVTLLTRSRIYWYLGIVFSVLGMMSTVSAFLLK
jgi:alpha-L-arabinofuranosidase